MATFLESMEKNPYLSSKLYQSQVLKQENFRVVGKQKNKTKTKTNNNNNNIDDNSNNKNN